jgi:hypothetical protein
MDHAWPLLKNQKKKKKRVIFFLSLFFSSGGLMNPLIILQGIPLWGKSFFIPLIMTYPECGLNLLDPEGGEPSLFRGFQKKIELPQAESINRDKNNSRRIAHLHAFFLPFF